MIRKVDSNSNSEMRLKDNNNENDKPLLCLLCCHYILQKANKNETPYVLQLRSHEVTRIIKFLVIILASIDNKYRLPTQNKYLMRIEVQMIMLTRCCLPCSR